MRARESEVVKRCSARAPALARSARRRASACDAPTRQTTSSASAKTARLIQLRVSATLKLCFGGTKKYHCASSASAAVTSPARRRPASDAASTMIRKTIAGVVVATHPPECGESNAVASTTPSRPPAVAERRRRVLSSVGGEKTWRASLTGAAWGGGSTFRTVSRSFLPCQPRSEAERTSGTEHSSRRARAGARAS